MRARCGHGWCTWRWRAAIAAAAVLYAAFTGWLLKPAAAAAWIGLGAAVVTALVALAVVPKPCPGDDIEAIARAVREDRLPREWTDGDWAELDKELST